MALMMTTRSAWLRSLQSISANGWLAPAPNSSETPNTIISTSRIFGIMPAPGADRLPNGRSPESANTMMPNTTKAAPAR